MKEKILSILKYFFKKVFIVFTITSIIVVIVSKFFHFELTNMFFYAGLAYMTIGVLPTITRVNLSFDTRYVQSQSISKSANEFALENFKVKDSCFNFLIFMCATGALLAMVGMLI